MWISDLTKYHTFEMDELYWFINVKKTSKGRENAHIMTLISRQPRQILAFNVDRHILDEHLQQMVDSVDPAKYYATDGYYGYLNVDFLGQHLYNINSKEHTFTVEGINSDLRHYISGLARKSRCFYRKLETLQAVLAVFINAYNKYGEYKLTYQKPTRHKSYPQKGYHKYQHLPLSILDFL